jgi:hypothetical protein
MSTAFRAHPVVRAAAVLGATAATLLLALPRASAAPNADLSPLQVSPTTVEIGEAVTVSGSGCLLDGEPRPFLVSYPGGPEGGAASGWSDATGSWSTTIRLDAEGPYDIQARCDMREGYESYDPVLVTVVAASAAPSGDAVTGGTGPTDDAGSGPAVPIALGGVAAVLLLGAGGYLAHRRRSTATNASASS